MNYPSSATKTVCLQDIADQARVSRATVSLALRNHTSISLETRMRVQEIAADLDYRPNPMVSALMTYQRTAKLGRQTHLTLAILLRFSRYGEWRSCVSEKLLETAATSARQHGYQLEEFWLDDLQLSGSRLEEVLYCRGIPGVIVAPFALARGHLPLDWSRFSAIAIGTSPLRPQLHRVNANCFDAMRLTLRRLRRMGYERIGLALRASHDARVEGHWSAAFLSEQQKVIRSRRLPALIVRDDNWTERHFSKWCEIQQPDVILGQDPNIITWLEKSGRRVPADVGFVQLSIPSDNRNQSGMQSNDALMAIVAVDMLVDLIRRNERGAPVSPRTVLLATSWVDGETIRPKPLASTPRNEYDESGIEGDLDFEIAAINGTRLGY